MARPKKKRTIRKKPRITYFKPQAVPLSQLSEIDLKFEELEALRLSEVEDLKQKEASQKMRVSRPTFQRVLAKARKKVAKALVTGQAIKVEGGDWQMPRGRGQGAGRGAGFGRGAGSSSAGSPQAGRGRMGGPFAAGPGGTCVCTNPDCGNEIVHQAGKPCFQTKCPKCGSPMTRKR